MASVISLNNANPIVMVNPVKERALDVRELSDVDIGAWSSLLAAAFDRAPADMASLLAWMRAGWGLVAYGVWDGDVLAAQYSCLRARLASDEFPQPIPIGMSVNMATHPDYRGRGLIKHAAAPVYEALKAAGVVAGVGFSNAAGVKVDRHSKGYGYQVVGQLRPFIIAPTLRHKPSPDFHLTQQLPPLAGLNMTTSGLQFDVTPHEITHRFGRHPFRTYQYGLWQDGDDVKGVVVFQHTRLFGRPAVSLLTAYSHDLDGLLSRWLAALPSGTPIHILTTPKSRVRDSLSRLRFCVTLPWQKSPYYLTVKLLSNQTSPTLMDFDQWECMGGHIL